MPITLKIWKKKLYHDPGIFIILEDIIINKVFYSPYLGLLYYTSCVSDIYKYQTELWSCLDPRTTYLRKIDTF